MNIRRGLIFSVRELRTTMFSATMFSVGVSISLFLAAPAFCDSSMAEVGAVFSEPAHIPSHFQPKRCEKLAVYSERRVSTLIEGEGEFEVLYRLCEADHAVYGSAKPVGARFGARGVQVPISCCPLPADDILSDVHTYVDSECPDGSVVTGIASKGNCSHVPLLRIARCGRDEGFFVRCTKLRTERYRLAAEEYGVQWGITTSEYAEKKIVLRKTIPSGIRSGIGRTGQYLWSLGGCIALTPGSLMVGKLGKRCHDLRFRKLLYLGDEGEWKAVPMFPYEQ